MNIAGDTHTHTIACGHAFSTLGENIAAAKALGHRFLCFTEHAPAMVDGMKYWYFKSMVRAVPREVDGLVMLRGTEVNILDEDGTLDLPPRVLEGLDWVVASLHEIFAPKALPRGEEAVARAWQAVARTPHVDCIGHLGNPRMATDYRRVLGYFKEGDKIVELNCSSHLARPGSDPNCREIAALCKEMELPMVLSSDAHFSTQIGDVQWGLDLIRDLDIPEDLVLNLDYDRFRAEIQRRRGILLPE